MLIRWNWEETGEESLLAFVNVMCFESSLFYRTIRTWWRPGQLSQYSDLLQTRRSGDRLNVAEKFSVTVQFRPEFHPASCTVAKRSFPGSRRPGHSVDYLFLLALGYELDGPIPMTALCAGWGISRGDLYLHYHNGAITKTLWRHATLLEI